MLVETNMVRGADYAGIIVDTNATSDFSDVTIRNNCVTRNCRRARKFGAICVNNCGRHSWNIPIADNVVADLGPALVAGRARMTGNVVADHVFTPRAGGRTTLSRGERASFRRCACRATANASPPLRDHPLTPARAMRQRHELFHSCARL